MSEWPPNWADLLRGIGCDMCENGRPDANSYGVRIHAGRYTDAYLPRAPSGPDGEGQAGGQARKRAAKLRNIT